MNGHLVSTRATAETCGRCRRLMLAGLDEGLPYRIDPAPLTALAELAALTARVRTYGLSPGGWVHYRNAGRIGADARHGRPAVYAEHHCARCLGPADIDPPHVPATAALIERATPAPALAPISVDMDALFLVSRDLGGRVIGLTGNIPPF
jgi:hypothetical protein